MVFAARSSEVIRTVPAMLSTKLSERDNAVSSA
jgi:hypothetical protein